MTMKNQIANPLPFPLSNEQRAAYNGIMNGQNIAVPACAGSGKSFTAFSIVSNYTKLVVSIPFSNKQWESEKIKFTNCPHVDSLNFHKRGKAMLGNVDVDNNKLRSLAQQINPEKAEQIAHFTAKLKSEAFGLGYDHALNIDQITEKYNIPVSLIPDIIECLKQSDAIKNIIDIQDMLRFPVLLGLTRHYPNALLLLDEVQDYTPDAWLFIKNCIYTPSNQIFMIGDFDHQLLMAFAGAKRELFDEMADFFNCEKLHFVENRRCSKQVVANARNKGAMVALSDAPEGYFGNITLNECIDTIKQGKHEQDAILCETNAPLIKLGIDLMSKGVSCQMRTEKLNKLIVRYCYRFLDTRKYQVGMMANELRKVQAQNINSESGAPDESFDDVIKVVEMLESYCLANGITKPTWSYKKPIHPIQQALQKLTNGNGITLLTGHTAKGLEWETVFHLQGKPKEPTQPHEVHQAECLAHVIDTRAKLNLYRISAE